MIARPDSFPLDASTTGVVAADSGLLAVAAASFPAFAVGVVAAEVEAEEGVEETDSWLLAVGELSGIFWRGEFFRGKRGRVGRREGEEGGVFPTFGWIEEGIIAVETTGGVTGVEEAKSNGGGSEPAVGGADGDFGWDTASGNGCNWLKCK